jgi:hypothetical protein
MDMRTEAPGHVVHTLAYFGSTLGYSAPPVPGSNAARAVAKVTKALVDFDARAASIQANNELSDQGRTNALQKMAPVRAEVQRMLAVLDGEIRGAEALNRALDEAIFESPQLAPDDVVGHLLDAEIRSGFALLGDTPRQTLKEEMATGKHRRIAEALARGPLPGIDRELALAAIRQHLSPEDAARLAENQQELADLEWARSAVDRMKVIISQR